MPMCPPTSSKERHYNHAGNSCVTLHDCLHPPYSEAIITLHFMFAIF